MFVYIAGPMRGIENWNMEAFDQAESRWRAAGHHVLSPARICRAFNYEIGNDQKVDSAHLKHVMLSDVASILRADALALLPGWENSVGSTVELALAQFLGMPVFDAQTMNMLHLATRPWTYAYTPGHYECGCPVLRSSKIKGFCDVHFKSFKKEAPEITHPTSDYKTQPVCTHCGVEFKDGQEVLDTIENMDLGVNRYVSLCRPCYDKAGNNVR